MTTVTREETEQLEQLAPVETPERLRLIEVAEWLERGGDEYRGVARFDMRCWKEEAACGTVCCIGGALQMFNRELLREKVRAKMYAPDYLDSEDLEILLDEHVPAIIGLSEEEADLLFYPAPGLRDRAWRAKPQQAAKVIRHLLATGKVDWNKAFE
jgi:hypothetical protein